MWHEIEGHRVYPGDGKVHLEITKKRQLKPGDEVVIFQRTSGLFRKKVDNKVSVRIQDEDNAMIVAERLQEPAINAGNFVVFPYQIPGHIATNTFNVTRQDVTITLGKNKERVNGVRWTNEMGIKPEPFASRLGRDFYDTDIDPEAQEMKKNLSYWNEMVLAGKIMGGSTEPIIRR